MADKNEKKESSGEQSQNLKIQMTSVGNKSKNATFKKGLNISVHSSSFADFGLDSIPKDLPDRDIIVQKIGNESDVLVVEEPATIEVGEKKEVPSSKPPEPSNETVPYRPLSDGGNPLKRLRTVGPEDSDGDQEVPDHMTLD